MTAPLRFQDVALGARFLAGLPSLLRHRVDGEKARMALRERLIDREKDFLNLVACSIFNRPTSPYLRLFHAAGCEYGDLELLVRKAGVESALSELFRAGIYLTTAEAKGQQPVVRNNLSFKIGPAELGKPNIMGHLISESGGSRGKKSPIMIDFELDRIRSQDIWLDFEARGALHCSRAIWGVPGTAALRRVINYTLCGTPPERWFSLVKLSDPQLHPRYLWSARALWLGGRLARAKLPYPTFVPLQDPRPILDWMLDRLRAGRIPQLYTYASCGVRLCESALEAGISLKGAQLILGGEATTPARLAVVIRSGATAQIQYGSVETDTLGRGCLAPIAADDLHLMHDRLAVIHPGAHADLPPKTLLVTSTYLPMAKLILLNVSLGDQGDVEERACGCPMEKLGWTTHIKNIRSFEKLTAGGMTFLDSDLIRVLEETLPARFGGGPTDYQLIDEETEDGRPGVRLLVHPRLGPLDERSLREQFLNAIAGKSGADRVRVDVWSQSNLPRVERTAPIVTAGGKVQHVHASRLAQIPDERRIQRR